MKVTKVIVSCDSSGDYAEMFPLVRETWKRICDYECIALFIGDELPAVLQEENEKVPGSVILFKPVLNMHTTFQAQCIRLLYPCLMENEVILISDMDIAPLSRDHFVNVLHPYYEPGHFVTFTDRYCKQKMFAMCYNAAHCDVWKNIFGVTSEQGIRAKLIEWYEPFKDTYDGVKNCPGWYTDQKQLYKHVVEMCGLVRLKDEETFFNRLDKKQKTYIVSHLKQVKYDVARGKYSDFHFIRPYKKFYNLIKTITDCARVDYSEPLPSQEPYFYLSED